MAYTNIDDPSAYFQAFTYTGNGTNRSITLDGNSDLQPDLYWYKTRSSSNYHYLADSSRGTTKYIYPNDSLAEGTVASAYVQSFDTNGVTLGGGDSGTNTNGTTFANWVWKANGGTNQGSNYQVNTTSGFSIGTYTGNRASVVTANHGLGAKLDFLLIKPTSAVGPWVAWHKSDPTKVMFLDTTDAAFGYGAYFDAAPNTNTSSFSVGDAGATNAAGVTYLFYGFAEKQGYSKFGKYVGNGNANGSFVYTGFKPEFVIVKRSDSANNWIITDNARGINGANPRLYADLTAAEGSAADYIDHLSNGFKIRTSAGSMNTSGGTYIYMAFAENPFVTSTGIPATAR